MRKVSLLILFSLLTVSIMAAAPLQFEKYWERGALVDTTEDNVRNIAVSPTGDMLATINIYAASDAIKLYNATSGLPNVGQESLDMGAIAPGKYNICSGGFSEDGAFFACNLDAPPWVAKDLTVYYWDDLSTGPKVIYTRASQAYRVGDAFDVIGRVDDNSVSVLIAGNGADSYPVRLTTADNGATWTPEILGNFVKATDVEQITGGAFFGTSAGANIVKYNADGSVAQDLAVGEALSCVAVDEALNLVYGMSGPKSGYPYLMSFDAATGAAVDNFSADPIDQGPATYDGYWNGSADIEIDVTAGGATRIFAVTEREGVARYSYGSVVNVGPTGDYATIAAALAAFSTGGELTTATLPLALALDTTVEFDEGICVGPTVGYTGYSSNLIVGDVIIRSDTPGTLAKIAAQSIGGGEGIRHMDPVNSLILKDLLIYPSQNGTVVTDNLIQNDLSDGVSDPGNWFELYNVIATDINVDGSPIITSKAEALTTEMPASTGSSLSGSDELIRQYGDALGETMNMYLDNCVTFGSTSYGFRFAVGGGSNESGVPDKIYLHNCLVARCAGYAIQVVTPSGYVGGNEISITGDDVTEGPMNCTAVYMSGNHGFWHTSSATSDDFIRIDGFLVETEIGTSARGYSGSSLAQVNAKNCLFDVPSIGIVESTSAGENSTFEKITCGSVLPLGDGTIEFTDCLFQSAPFGTSALTFNNCAFTTNSATDATLNDCITAPDFGFISEDGTSADFYDVTNAQFASAASDGGDLAGGADFVAGGLWEYVADAYTSGTEKLSVDIAADDLLEGKSLDVVSGSWYALPGNGLGVGLTNGIYDANGVADLIADNASPSYALEVEYDFFGNDQQDVNIEKIRIFAGHDGDGSRAFINCDVSVDIAGTGYALAGSMKTGAFGKANETDASAYCEWNGFAENVQKIKFSFYDVSHNSTGFFQAPDDNTTNPPVNYPNQGTILKEVDVFGTSRDVPSSVDDWMLF